MTISDRQRARWTLVAAIVGLGVTVTDETIVFLALPAIEQDLVFGLTGQQWIVNAYLLALASLLLLGGSLADRYGRRRLFLLGLALFGAASATAGLSYAAEMLIAARVAQGVGAALLMPATLALVTASHTGEERGSAIGSWAAWGSSGAAVAPLIAGVLIDTLSWRFVFFLNLPFVALAAALALWAVEESHDPDAGQRPLDVPGAALGVTGLVGLAFALVQGPEVGWTSPSVVATAVLGLAALAAFVWHEHRTEAPLLPLQLFTDRDFAAGNGTTLALYAAFNGAFFVLVIYLQSTLGYSALAAGAATLPVTLLMLALSSRFGGLTETVGPRPLMTGGLLVATAGLGSLALLQPGDSYLTGVFPGVILFGIGLAATVAPMTTTVMGAVPEQRGGLASGINDAVARMAALLGVALVGLVFAATFRSQAPPPPPPVDPAVAESLAEARDRPTTALQIDVPSQVEDDVVPVLRSASVAAYRAAMAAGAITAAIGALVALLGIRPSR